MRNILEVPLMDNLSLFLYILKHNGISNFLDGLYYFCFPCGHISHKNPYLFISHLKVSSNILSSKRSILFQNPICSPGSILNTRFFRYIQILYGS